MCERTQTYKRCLSGHQEGDSPLQTSGNAHSLFFCAKKT
jgi:hypothetical protein